MILETSNNLPTFSTELRLIVLTQLSSWSVERICSRVKDVRETCSDALYEDMSPTPLGGATMFTFLSSRSRTLFFV